MCIWSFILTMRNVNSGNAMQFRMVGGAFYINYEECKFGTRLCCGSRSFQFYINYEECKLGIGIMGTMIGVCFILTMRNVNFLVVKPRYS